MNYFELLKAGKMLQKTSFAKGKIVSPTDYERIARIVRNGEAQNYFNIGDQIITTYTDTGGTSYEMPWDIVDFRTAELENGDIVPSMVLQSHYATAEEVQFDAAEPDRPEEQDYQGQIAQYGWNRYAMSAMRQWLNSDKAAGEWWTAQHEYDAAPTQAATINGFMRGFPAEFLAMLKPVKVMTVRNYRDPDTAQSSGTYEYDTTYDIFRLPSREEEYCTVNEPNHKEGSVFQYWVDILTAPALEIGETLPQALADSQNNHIIKAHRRFLLDNQSSAATVRLRSAARNSANGEYHVYTAGSVANVSARNAYRCAPACEIC